jgi:hypothetical protein
MAREGLMRRCSKSGSDEEECIESPAKKRLISD